MNPASFLLGLFLLLPGCRCSRPGPPAAPLPASPIAAFWAAGDGDGITRHSRAPATPSPLWDGHRVQLHAAGNEIVAFQLVVRAGTGGIRELRARLLGLVHPAGGGGFDYRPPAADSADFRSRPIQIFSVGYMKIEKPSRADWIYSPGGPDAPGDPLGWKPVQLIPENARPGRGGFPLSVRPGENQALWFEIYTGREHPPGLYQGTITITADGQEVAVPLSLELYPFTLPDENSLVAMVYYESQQPQRYHGRDLDAHYHRFAHRQRIELVHGYELPALRAAMGRFDGSEFAPGRYQGPGEGVGNRIVPASFYGPGEGWQDQAAAWSRADAWMSFLGQHLPRAITFLYMPDEPGPEEFPFIRSLADRLHANPGPGRALPMLVTRPFTPELEGAIDIWCSVAAELDLSRAARERSAGRDWWLYNGGRPAGPALVIEAPPSDARVIGWAAFKAGVRVYFFWHAVHWRHNGQKKIGDRVQNVWANPVTFDARDARGQGDFANGEGVLIYPGRDRLHPQEDRGIDGPVSTLRLANLRRGLQDHLYLTLARERGLDALVSEVLAEIVPRVFTEAGRQVSFPERTQPFEHARLRLGRALSGSDAVARPP